MKHAQFTTIESYNEVNVAIAQYKDSLTNGEYSRTETAFEYNPNPEPHWNGMFYMPAKPNQVEAGLFEGVTLLDEIPIEVIEE